jgi:hypothetical protein
VQGKDDRVVRSPTTWNKIHYHIEMRECEYTHIPMALIKYPQGNLEEIQQKILQSTQKEPGGHQDRKARAYTTGHY